MTGNERLDLYLDEYKRLPKPVQLVNERKEKGLPVTIEWAVLFCRSEQLRVEYNIAAARLAIRLEDAAAPFKEQLQKLEDQKKEVDAKRNAAAERMNTANFNRKED